MRIFDIEDQANALSFISNTYCKSNWKYGQLANSEKAYDQGHWKTSLDLGNVPPLTYDHSKMPFLKRHPAIQVLWEQLKSILGDDHILIRAYINGYTYGTDGYAHRDDPWINSKYGSDTASETCIFFLNSEWHHDWSGETVIFNEELEIESAVLPKANRLIIFDSQKLHAARPLSRCCTELRKVLVMKTSSSVANEPRVDFIRDLYSDEEFARLYKIASTMYLNDVADNVVQAAMYLDIYKDNKTEPFVMKEHLGLYGEELISHYHDLHHTRNCLIEELENSKELSPIMKRDLALLHHSKLYEDYGPQEDMQRLQNLVNDLESNDA